MTPMFRRRRRAEAVPSGRVIRRAMVRLVDLVPPPGAPPAIEEVVFENCLIVGPAVVGILDACQFDHCTFNYDGRGTIENILWSLPDDEWVVGCIGLRACLFERCEFRSIGFAGRPETLDNMRRQLTS